MRELLLAIMGVIIVILLLEYYDNYFRHNDTQIEGFEYYDYTVPLFTVPIYYPYYNSGCIENAFGKIYCYSEPFFY